MEKTTVIIKALQEQGFNNNEAAKLLELSRQYTHRLGKPERVGALFPLIKLAQKAVKTTLKGEAVGSASTPKAGDVIAAAKMVLDRSDPVIQKLETTKTTYNIDLPTEDRDKYLKALGITPEKVIEANYTLVEENNEALAIT